MITPHPGYEREGRVWLWLDDTPVGSFAHAFQAAEDVAMHHSGAGAWDRLPSQPSDPRDLEAWQRHF
jgi:hypothetical protein